MTIPDKVMQLKSRMEARRRAGILPKQYPAKERGKPVARTGPCRNLGIVTGELVSCPSCRGGRVQLKVFNCSVHGTCTMGRRVDGKACCVGCPDYVA